MTQSESQLETNLINQLVGEGYTFAKNIVDEENLITNFREKLEVFNNTKLSDAEFAQIRNFLMTGDVFDRAKKLRDAFTLKNRENNQPDQNIRFLDQQDFSRNIFQVAHQIVIDREVGARYDNRYDVTLLVNGLPLVQIELKRRDGEIQEAFNQVNRYNHDSFGAGDGFFRFVQLFVISNGVDTKYFANSLAKNKHSNSFDFTSFWTGRDNSRISELGDFAKTFLRPEFLAKFIAKYMVLTTDKKLMALRPYQFYAAEAITAKVREYDEEHPNYRGGYVWHTTGSGKTLTSFTAATLISQNPDVAKTVFIVDRKDLDTQTIEEFRSFRENSVDTTENTAKLIRQFNDTNIKLIVTTIQKLDRALMNPEMLTVKDSRTVFIFDECHRSQFGETHRRIVRFFTKAQMFGFTGTPIFRENSIDADGFQTTERLFGECLHSYKITDAISDRNVLPFGVEYYDFAKIHADASGEKVRAIDEKEVLESPERMEKIVDCIIKNHDQKTRGRKFSAIFAVSSIEVLMKYYRIFREKNSDLRVAAIFSYAPNSADPLADSMLDDEPDLSATNLSTSDRRSLDEIVADYNDTFDTNFDVNVANGFDQYYRDIISRMKRKNPDKTPIDILLVVNMMLTGFDSKFLNTLYVDKNLRYHGLLQAFSRTNRILNDQKPIGQIVSFRALKDDVDDALALFARGSDYSIVTPSFDGFMHEFNKDLAKLFAVTPSPRDVDSLKTEEEKAEFVRNFRELLRIKNVLTTFAEFDANTLSGPNISPQSFTEFTGKYRDMAREVFRDESTGKASVLGDIDFEISLAEQDTVNNDYIKGLMSNTTTDDDNARRIELENAMKSDPRLFAKRDLIEAFLKSKQTVSADNYAIFVDQKRSDDFAKLVAENGLRYKTAEEWVNKQNRSGIVPRDIFLVQPNIENLRSMREDVTNKLLVYMEKYEL